MEFTANVVLVPWIQGLCALSFNTAIVGKHIHGEINSVRRWLSKKINSSPSTYNNNNYFVRHVPASFDSYKLYICPPHKNQRFCGSVRACLSSTHSLSSTPPIPPCNARRRRETIQFTNVIPSRAEDELKIFEIVLITLKSPHIQSHGDC